MRRFFLFVSVFTVTLLPLQGAIKVSNSTNENHSENGSKAAADEALLKQISRGFSRVAKKAVPAVVFIESQVNESHLSHSKKQRQKQQESPFDYFNDDFFNHFFGIPNPQYEAPAKKHETVRGSGALVSPDGYIMTNNHVVENATKVQVTLNGGKKMTAKVIGTDPKTDLAVIKIEGKDLPYLQFGNSDTLEVGDWAIAVGSPFELEATVTVGVISAKGRNQLHITEFEDFIQTDAAINPGNSGGPLLNVDGEVIGINTAIVSGSGGYMGIGFAIPSNMAKRIMEQLVANGSVTRGFLGVTLQPIDSDLALYYKLDHAHGALITDVVKGSPADAAGIKQEDVIVSYNGIPVETLSGFRNAVSLMAPGSELKLEVMREGKLKKIDVKIATIPGEAAGPNSVAQKLGIQVQNLTPELASQIGVGSSEKGVVVTQVKAGSPAADGGVRPGQLIMAVNRKKVTTIEEFELALQEASKEECILLMVRQGEAVRFIALKLQ